MRARVLAFCLLVAILGVGAQRFWSESDEEASLNQFLVDFDRNIKNVPIAADLVARDPEFRARVLKATAKAYERGGWAAADDALTAAMAEKQPIVTWRKLNADDALVVALWTQYLSVGQALRDRPAACRAYLSGGGSAVSLPSARSEYRAASEIAREAYFSGKRNLAGGRAPAFPSSTWIDLLLERSTERGQGFTPAEWAAIRERNTPLRSATPDNVACAAEIKFLENLLVLPESEASALIRGHWGSWIPAEIRQSSATLR